jgi:hypothetical protein
VPTGVADEMSRAVLGNAKEDVEDEDGDDKVVCSVS